MRTTVSNDTGSYVAAEPAARAVSSRGDAPGVRTFAQTGIVLQVNSSPVVNPVLGVGAVAEEVQVTGNAPLVDTRSTGVGTVVESERIVELPLNARQVTQLITLSGFAVQTAASPGYSMNTGVRISVAGGNDFGVSYSLDGAPHLNNFDGTGMHLPFPDALQEFRLVTGAQEARRDDPRRRVGERRHQGRHQHVSMAACSSSCATAASTRRTSFSRAEGRPEAQPVRRHDRRADRARQDCSSSPACRRTTTRQNPLDQTAFVPTAAMLAGDFTAFASPACNSGRQLTLGAPFVNNRIDPRLISPAALNVSRRLPTPIDDCGKVFWGAPVHQNEAQIPIRVDFQANQAHSFVVRYMLTTDDRADSRTTRPATTCSSPTPRLRRPRAQLHLRPHLGDQLRRW